MLQIGFVSQYFGNFRVMHHRKYCIRGRVKKEKNKPYPTKDAAISLSKSAFIAKAAAVIIGGIPD